MTANDRYYLRHEDGRRWWSFPWSAWRGPDYPYGILVGIAITRKGALRVIRRDQRIKGVKTEVISEGARQ